MKLPDRWIAQHRIFNLLFLQEHLCADLNFSCSSSRLTSSLRGLPAASTGASGSAGNNIFDLM